MGKRRKSGGARDSASGGAANKELERLLLQILDTTTRIPDAKEEWDQYIAVHSLVESVRSLEQGKQPACFAATGSRSASVDAFVQWLTSNGVDMHKVCLDDYGPLGLGLKAAAPLKAAEKFLSIPRKIMMLSDVRADSPLSTFIQSDPIASKMQNVALALEVLHERTAAESFWAPYLDVLPASYSTPLYFSPQDLEQLRGSPCLSECLGLYRSIARQYAYFHRLLVSDSGAAQSGQQPGLPLLGRFTYDGYRWAVSTVMTRQNCVPRASHGSAAGECSALIPLWDMCNHAPGEMSTDYSTDCDCSQSYVCTDYTAGQQIFICYGYRSNREFFLHSGFVSPDNPYDRLLVKLGLSKNDPLFAQRSLLLEKVGLSSSQSYELQYGKQPVTAPLLAFLRIFNASPDELETLSASCSSSSGTLIALLTDSSVHVSRNNSTKSWSFLAGRVDLLLRAYQGSPQSDQIRGTASSPNADLIRSLVAEEKKILQCTLSYCRAQAESLQSAA